MIVQSPAVASLRDTMDNKSVSPAAAFYLVLFLRFQSIEDSFAIFH
jgi:hypothetical protein